MKYSQILYGVQGIYRELYFWIETYPSPGYYPFTEKCHYSPKFNGIY